LLIYGGFVNFNFIEGTSGNDNIVGTIGSDEILGYAGDDFIVGD